MRTVSWLAIISALGLPSCERSPESYPIPAQYQPKGGAGPPMLAPVVSNAGATVLGGIHPDPTGNGWHWTEAHPRFAFRLNRTDNLELVMRLEVHAIPFSHTGPITVSIRVNGQLIGAPRYESIGVRDFAAPVPAALLEAQNPAMVSMDIDSAWTDEGGTVYGVLLAYAGFREREE